MRFAWLFMLCACDLGTYDGDEFWDETRDDDGTVVVAAGANKRVAIAVGKTDDAELIETLPVARSESGANRRVALHLGPSELPSLEPGDRLFVPAEVQVTTRCDIGQSAPGCNYNPNVRAQLIIAGSATDTNGGGAGSKVLATQTQSCTKDEHHCMFVFRPAATGAKLDRLPCMPNNCHVNLVLWAWHPDARSGDQDKVLVGGNDGDYLMNGDVEPDLARLMVVRERNVGAADRASKETSGGNSLSVNTNANPELVFAHRLKQGDLVKGEQFMIEARIEADTSSRARFSTELFVSKDPNARTGNGIDRTAPGSINEHNGFNCNSGRPCVTHKVAVFRVTDDIAGPVFVNAVVKSAVPGGGSARVTVRRGDSWIRSVRYAAQLAD